mgnify:CR=1 FL=1
MLDLLCPSGPANRARFDPRTVLSTYSTRWHLQSPPGTNSPKFIKACSHGTRTASRARYLSSGKSLGLRTEIIRWQLRLPGSPGTLSFYLDLLELEASDLAFRVVARPQSRCAIHSDRCGIRHQSSVLHQSIFQKQNSTSACNRYKLHRCFYLPASAVERPVVNTCSCSKNFGRLRSRLHFFAPNRLVTPS